MAIIKNLSTLTVKPVQPSIRTQFVMAIFETASRRWTMFRTIVYSRTRYRVNNHLWNSISETELQLSYYTKTSLAQQLMSKGKRIKIKHNSWRRILELIVYNSISKIIEERAKNLITIVGSNYSMSTKNGPHRWLDET